MTACNIAKWSSRPIRLKVARLARAIGLEIVVGSGACGVGAMVWTEHQ
jgi:hypothetical protein